MGDYLNPHTGKYFTPKLEEGKYYNLESGRNIGKDGVKKKKFETSEKPFPVAGPKEILEKFLANPKGIVKLGEKKEVKSRKEYVPTTTDIAQIPRAALLSLSVFSLKGLFTKVSILRTLDGDTVIVSLFVPPEFLTARRAETTKEKKEMQKSMGLVFPETQGFFMSVDCRLYGVDASEHSTELGEQATIYMKGLYRDLDYIAYARFFASDKYGRALVTLYEDPDMKVSLTQKLLDYRFNGEPVALPYQGKTKSLFMKEQKKLTPAEVRAIKRPVEDKPGQGVCAPVVEVHCTGLGYNEKEPSPERDPETWREKYSEEDVPVFKYLPGKPVAGVSRSNSPTRKTSPVRSKSPVSPKAKKGKKA